MRDMNTKGLLGKRLLFEKALNSKKVEEGKVFPSLGNSHCRPYNIRIRNVKNKSEKIMELCMIQTLPQRYWNPGTWSLVAERMNPIVV